jgi:TM2 domain-containing membrane protein YozV
MIEFTIADEPDQNFSIVLGGRRVTIRLWYAVFNDRWSADIAIDGEPKLYGRKIVAGVDLLAAFNLGIGVIFANIETGSASPGRDQLVGGLVKIYHATQEEIDASISS